MQINKLEIHQIAQDLLKKYGASFSALVAGINAHLLYSAAKGAVVAATNERKIRRANDRLRGFDCRKLLMAMINDSSVSRIATKLDVTQSALFELRKDEKRKPSTFISYEVFKIWESYK